MTAVLEEAKTTRVGQERAWAIAEPFIQAVEDAERVKQQKLLAKQAKAKAAEEARVRQEAENLLDSPLPELPVMVVEASSAAAEALRAKFDDAVQALLDVFTKPAEKFVGTRHKALDLKWVAGFLRQVAARLQEHDRGADAA